MKYKITQIKQNTSVLTMADIIDATKKLSPDPIKEIRVGYEMYEEMLKDAKAMFKPRIKFKDKVYLGSIFGVKILIDPDLKPDEYKIITT